MNVPSPRILRRLAARSAPMLMLLAAVPGGAQTTAAERPRLHRVVIDQMAFDKIPANVRVGDVILWVNKDMFRHTVTARNRAFDVDLMPGASARTTITQAGLLAYYCRYHPGMSGSFRVAGQER